MNTFYVYSGPKTYQWLFATRPHFSVKELMEHEGGPGRIVRRGAYGNTSLQLCVVMARPGSARVTISNGGVRAISAILVAGQDLASEMEELARFACEMRHDPVVRELMHSGGEPFKDLPSIPHRPLMARMNHAKTCDCEITLERESQQVVEQSLRDLATVFFQSVPRNIS
jgi:hypothetical protein